MLVEDTIQKTRCPKSGTFPVEKESSVNSKHRRHVKDKHKDKPTNSGNYLVKSSRIKSKARSFAEVSSNIMEINLIYGGPLQTNLSNIKTKDSNAFIAEQNVLLSSSPLRKRSVPSKQIVSR